MNTRQALAAAARGVIAGIGSWCMLFVFGVLPARLADDPGVLLFAAAGALAIVVSPRVVACAFATLSILVAIVALSPAADFLQSWWVRDDPFPAAGVTAVIALSGGVNPDTTVSGDALDHLINGIELVRDGRAGALVTTTTEELFPTGAVSSDVDQQRVVSLLGARITWIRVPGGRSTHDEAVGSAKILLPRRIRSIAVITSPMHTRRACAVFEAVGFAVTCVAARTRDASGRPLAPTPAARMATFGAWVYEITAVAEYRVRGWL